MRTAGIAAALAAAAIWALVVFVYKRHLSNADVLAVNFSRLLYASALTSPSLALAGPAAWLPAAAASGLLALAAGDTLFLFAVRRAGASVAAPLAYAYVVVSQHLAAAFGERTPLQLLASSLLLVAGVALLARGGGSRRDAAGVAAALCASLLWALGMAAFKLAALEMSSPLAVAHVRALAACAALGACMAVEKRLVVVKSPALAAAAVFDVGIGAALFALSVKHAGLALATILASTSPLITQAFAVLMGLERVSRAQAAGAAAILAAVVTALGC